MRNAALFKGTIEEVVGGRSHFWRENSVVLNLDVAVAVAVASECKRARFSDFHSDLSLTNISLQRGDANQITDAEYDCGDCGFSSGTGDIRFCDYHGTGTKRL